MKITAGSFVLFYRCSVGGLRRRVSSGRLRQMTTANSNGQRPNHINPNHTTPGHGNQNKPRLIFWELTKGCNLRCIHCRASATELSSPADLSTETAKAIIDQIAT